MCICVNCRHIKQCKTYHFIEKQHKNIFTQKINSNSIFVPINTLMQVNVKQQESIFIDWDLVECLSFVDQPGSWLNE